MRERLAVAAAAVLSHAFSLRAGFIWLDHAHLEDGLALSRVSALHEAFTRGFAGTGYYRPLMSVSLSLDAALGGAPALYHATTLAWHAAASVMTAVLGERLGLSRRAAMLAGLLFATHPITGLVSNAIAFRSEAMLATLLLGMLVTHLAALPWASGLLLLAAALTKETALLLGPLLLASSELFGPKPALPKRQRLRVFAAEGLALALALGLRQAFAPPWRAHFPALSLSEALGTRLAGLAKSAQSLLLPLDVGVCDAFPISDLATLPALAGLGVLLALAYVAYRRRGLALLLVLALLPSWQLVPVMRWWSPHYLYVPLAFAALLVVETLERYAEQALRAAAPVALALGGLSLLDSRRFDSDEELWSKEVRLDARCREGQFFLGDVAFLEQRFDEAARRYSLAASPQPRVISYVDQQAALQNLGVAKLKLGRFDEARAAFRAALSGPLDEGSRRQLQQNLASLEALSALQTKSAEPAPGLPNPDPAD